jgi:type I restriction enzyme S subunit
MALDDLDESRVNLQFLTSVLKGADFSKVITGVAQPQITGQSLSRFQIPLPPLAEQKRIAAILDAADALRTKRREALAQLDVLLQSTFLTLFGDPVANPMGLSKKTLETAFQFTTGKLDSNAANEGGEYPFFTCARETFAIDEYAFDCEALLLAGNNANADYSVKHYKGKFNAYQRTYVITVDETILTYEYARFALEYMLGDLKRFSKGTNTKYLTMVILNRMPILVPSLDEQRGFAAIVESVERQKAAQRTHLAELDALFAALQHRAFRGEL